MVSAEHLRPLLDAPDPEHGEPRAFSLMDLWRDYTAAYQTHGKQNARDQQFWLILMNLRSIRQEGVGKATTDDIVTHVIKTSDDLIFQKLNYKDGHDLEAYYLLSMEKLRAKWWLGKARKDRYIAEAEQTVLLWKTAAAVLHELNLETDTISPQLLSKGFVVTHLPMSVGLRAAFPQVDKTQNEIEVLMGPPLVSVSPPSTFHRNGETSFAWISRLFFIPSLNAFTVIQNGHFTAYSKSEVIRFLQYHNPNSDHIAKLSSLELLKYIHVLDEFTATHSLALIDAIVQDIGYFKAPPPIDKQIKLTDSDQTPIVHAILDIFEWEAQQCQKHPELLETLHLRFSQWQEALLHTTVGGFTFDHQAFVQEYVQFYSDRSKAMSPQKFKRDVLSRITRIYPSFRIRLNLSKLDCVAGSLTGLGRLTSSDMARLYGPMAEGLLAKAELYGINTQDELRVFCKTFKIPVDLFHKNTDHTTCPGCGKVTAFIGPCVCPLCHVHDNLGKLHVPQQRENKEHEPVEGPSFNLPFKHYASFLDLLHDDIYEEVITLPESESESMPEAA